jgi:hypothetical protein
MSLPVHETKKSISDRIVTYVVAAAGLLFLALAVLKAYYSPFTHDESLSYNLYAGYSVPDIISYVRTYGLTNNHVLNTLLLKLCGAVFGSSTLGLRLPNLLAFAAYLYIGYRLLKRLQSPWLLLGGFLLLAGNLFMNDFFALARGYGLANALLLAAVWQLLLVMEKPTVRKHIAVMVFSGLAVLANFTLLHVALTVVAVHTFIMYRQQRPVNFKAFLKTSRYALFFLPVMGALLYEPFRTIIKWNTTFGGYDTFWNSAVKGLLIGTIYTPENIGWLTAAEIITAVVVAAITVIILMGIRKKVKTDAPVYLALLFVPALLFILQHLLLGSAYPVNRTVQYMIPIFILALAAAIPLLPRMRNIPAYGIAVAGICSGIYFAGHYSELVYSEWQYDASDKVVMDDLNTLREGKPVKLAINWMLEPGLNFERNRRQATWLVPPDRGGLNREADFYYCFAEDTAALAASGKKQVRVYPISKTYLYK